MRADGVAAERFHVIQRGAEPDGLDDRRRARFEAMRRLAVGDVSHVTSLDHLAAAGEGRQCCQPFALP